MPHLFSKLKLFIYRETSFRHLLMLTLFYTFLLSLPGWLSYAEDGSFHLAKLRGLTAILAALLPALIFARIAALKKSIEIIISTILSILLIADIWMFFMLHTPFSEKILTLILATNAGEASEFFNLYVLQPKSPGIIFTSLAAIDIIYFLIDCMLPKHLPTGNVHKLAPEKNSSKCPKPILIILSILISSFLILSLIINYLGLFTGQFRSQLGFTTLEEIWFATRNYYQHSPDIKKLEETHLHYMSTDYPSSYGTSNDSLDSPTHIYWIIGESYNKHHSSLYGYPLPTSPQISKEVESGNLILFNHAVTPSSATDEVMRLIFSPHQDMDNTQWTETPLLPAIFRKNGWKVSYLDNQTTLLHGDQKWDTGNAFFLNSPLISNYNFDYRNSSTYPYDLEMVKAELPAIVGHDSTKNQFAIFHLMGQHMQASKRYPKEYEHFRIEDYNYRKDLTEAQKIDVAHYDNATRYNDKVISEIISSLQPTEDAIVIYHSDHGEEIHDYRRQYGRTLEPRNPNIDRNIYEIPFIIYTTPAFRKRHPRLYDRLCSDADRPINIDTIANYLMHIAGIRHLSP